MESKYERSSKDEKDIDCVWRAGVCDPPGESGRWRVTARRPSRPSRRVTTVRRARRPRRSRRATTVRRARRPPHSRRATARAPLQQPRLPTPRPSRRPAARRPRRPPTTTLLAENVYAKSYADTGCTKTAQKAAYDAVYASTSCDKSSTAAATHAVAKASYNETLDKTGCEKTAEAAYASVTKTAGASCATATAKAGCDKDAESSSDATAVTTERQNGIERKRLSHAFKRFSDTRAVRPGCFFVTGNTAANLRECDIAYRGGRVLWRKEERWHNRDRAVFACSRAFAAPSTRCCTRGFAGPPMKRAMGRR